MDHYVVLAFRAGQLHQQGKSIKEAFEQAAREESIMHDWAVGLKRYSMSLDALIAKLQREKAEREKAIALRA
jgi:hypothetical protein